MGVGNNQKKDRHGLTDHPAVGTQFVVQFITLAISAMAISAISGFRFRIQAYILCDRRPSHNEICDLLAVAFCFVRVLRFLRACAEK